MNFNLRDVLIRTGEKWRLCAVLSVGKLYGESLTSNRQLPNRNPDIYQQTLFGWIYSPFVAFSQLRAFGPFIKKIVLTFCKIAINNVNPLKFHHRSKSMLTGGGESRV